MASKVEPKPQTVAIIAENALFPQAAASAGAKKAEEFGFKLVYNEKYPTGIKDMSSNLAAVREQHPDILLGAGYTPDTCWCAKCTRWGSRQNCSASPSARHCRPGSRPSGSKRRAQSSRSSGRRA
jgi:hypothetical protein